MDAVLRARGLVKAFHGAPAVDGVDLDVATGERVALLGPNGAGKTTTLFMLLGLVAPDAGWVELAGHRLPAHREEAMAEVGFAAGYLPLPERVRVGEFLSLYADLHDVARPRLAIDAALDRFGASGLQRSMGNELSAGQRTLIGIVKATLHRPRLLVLDEPTASLDPEVARRVRTGLEQVGAEGTALLVTSHDMAEVERLCSRVVFLARGRVVADGSPSDVAARFRRTDLEGVFLHLAEQAPGAAGPPAPGR